MLLEIGSGWAVKKAQLSCRPLEFESGGAGNLPFFRQRFFMGGGIVVFSDNRLFNTR